MTMNLNQLRIFSEVYKTGSTTKAAENLYISQPAVSRAVSEIEKEYGVRLFERFHHRLMPSAAGRDVYEKAERILSAYAELEMDLSEADHKKIITIGSTVTAGNFLLPSFSHVFHQKHPEIKLHVCVSNGASLVKMIHDNEVDTAIIEEQVNDPDIVCEKIGKSRMAALCSVKSSYEERMSLSQLAEKPLLLREEGSAARHYVDDLFASLNLKPKPEWESASSQALLRAASYDLGIALVPDLFAKEFIQNGQLREIKITETDLYRSVMLCHHKDKYLSDGLKTVMDELRCYHLF